MRNLIREKEIVNIKYSVIFFIEEVKSRLYKITSWIKTNLQGRNDANFIYIDILLNFLVNHEYT